MMTVGRILKFLIASMVVVSVSADSLRFAVERHIVAEPIGGDTKVEQVVFLDKDPFFRVFFPAGMEAPGVDLADWNSVLSFEICREQSAGEILDCEEANISPLGFGRVSGSVQFRGKLVLEDSGNFILRVHGRNSSLKGSTRLKVLTGDESDHVRDGWLRAHAESARSWEAYKEYQLSRAELFPDRLTPYQQLAFKGARMAPEDEAHEMIDLLISRIEAQRGRLVTAERRQWLEDELANFRWLKTQLHRLRADHAVTLSWERGDRRSLAIVEAGSRKVVDRAPLPRRIGQ
jgi:hypothetical protein